MPVSPFRTKGFACIEQTESGQATVRTCGNAHVAIEIMTEGTARFGLP